MQETTIKQRKGNVNWKQIKVVFVPAMKTKSNPLNPNSKLHVDDRKKRLLELSARIWARKS